ncbi:MAG: DUF1273 family protein [Clostridia bacterium]|nr:DUF1273 family protein [Clostridia bacterium]
MKNSTATFIGHRECFYLDVEKLKNEIEALICSGYKRFLFGGMGCFDLICAKCVYKLKQKYSNVTSALVIPYLTFNIEEDYLYDEIIYPNNFEKYYFKAAIIKRNEFLVDNSSIAICFVKYNGGAKRTYEYALKKGIKVLNLFI